MIISEEQIKQSIKYLRASQSKQNKKTALKTRKHDIGSLRDEIEKLPPARDPRLDEIKESLASRHYFISSHQVAEKIIGRALSDQIR